MPEILTAPPPRPAARTQAISLRQLRFFTALADTGNFSRAAERMIVSQPALSAGIRQIEEHLGVRLFERSTHHVSLSEAGAAFLPHALRLLKTADNAFVDMSDVAARGKAVVRIGAIPSVVPAAAEVVARLSDHLDDVSFHLSDGKNDTLFGSLRTGALDIVIGVLGRAEEGLEATLIAEDEMLLVAPKDHPLSASTSLPLERVGRQRNRPLRGRQHRGAQLGGDAPEQSDPLDALQGRPGQFIVGLGWQRPGGWSPAQALYARP
jgi:DNA-binding transcriptional LysR family regulator